MANFIHANDMRPEGNQKLGIPLSGVMLNKTIL